MDIEINLTKHLFCYERYLSMSILIVKQNTEIH